jgi:hypothetical protein
MSRGGWVGVLVGAGLNVAVGGTGVFVGGGGLVATGGTGVAAVAHAVSATRSISANNFASFDELHMGLLS